MQLRGEESRVGKVNAYLWDYNNRFLWINAIASRQSLSIHTRIILSRICTVAQRRTLAVLKRKKMNHCLLDNLQKSQSNPYEQSTPPHRHRILGGTDKWEEKRTAISSSPSLLRSSTTRTKESIERSRRRGSRSHLSSLDRSRRTIARTWTLRVASNRRHCQSIYVHTYK